MYLDHWQLQFKPFENTPDPRFIYWSKQHEEALSRMLYVIEENKGAALITGEYGSGKTLLTRVLVNRLAEKDNYQEALVLNPMLSPAPLIKEIIRQLGGDAKKSTTKADAFNRLNEMLVEIKNKGKLAVIIIDEAQAIARPASFEEFRLMLNFQLNESFLLTLVLIGQPELKAKIAKLPQLEQRFHLKFHLNALDENETRSYILHRIKIAGGGEIFTDAAMAEIFQYTAGIPRKINSLCDIALLAGSGEGVDKIDRPIIRKVIEDFEGKEAGKETKLDEDNMVGG